MANYKGGALSSIWEDTQRLGVIRKFTCFFNSADFLMTEYYPLTDSIHAIFEFESGDTLQYDNLLCGYGGTGPSNTVTALTSLGIPRQDADRYCRSGSRRGVQLEMAQREDGTYYVSDATFNCWFEQLRDYDMFPSWKISVSPVRRTVVIATPENRLDILHTLIRYCQPYLMEYSTDAKEPLYSQQDLHDSGLMFSPYEFGEKTNANVVISGNRFTLLICFRNDALLSMINSLCYSLTGRPLFYVYRLWRFLYLSDQSIWRMTLFDVLRLLHDGSITKTRGSIQIKSSGGRRPCAG